MPCSCSSSRQSLEGLQLEWKLRALGRWYSNAPVQTVGLTLGVAGVGAALGMVAAHLLGKNELAGAKAGAGAAVGLGFLALMALPAT